jgi:hypothetical protein
VREFKSNFLVFGFVVVDCRVHDCSLRGIDVGFDKLILHVDGRDVTC